MIAQKIRGEEDASFTLDEVKPTKNFCLADVSVRMDDYKSCGEPLRRRKDGSTHCKHHGEMH